MAVLDPIKLVIENYPRDKVEMLKADNNPENDADGTREGYDLELLKAISLAVSIPVVASGGAGNLNHLLEAIVEGMVDAVLAASIFHFGTYSIAQAKEFLFTHGIPIRPIDDTPKKVKFS